MFNLIYNSINKKKVSYFLTLISFLISFLLCNSYTFSQKIIEVHGKIIDSASGKSLVAVSIVANKYKGTVTNSKGEFHLSVDESLIKEKGLIFSYVGYKKKHIPFSQNIFLKVEMALADNNIAEVVVYGGGKSILQKAIEKIPINYPLEPFVQKGAMRVYNTVGDSDYFFKSDASVEVHFPSYIEHNKDIEIKVMGNEQILLKNPKYQADTKWLGGFASISDIVHQYPDYINKNKLKHYQYHEREKTVIEGRKVFVIDFNSQKNKDIEGTLYIDTATYAFVGADITQYNINGFGFVPISVAKQSIRYQMIDSKWYIKSAHGESTHVMKIMNNNYIRDYVAISIDTTNISALPYKDVVQDRDENIKILKVGNDGGKINDSIFTKLESDSDISYIAVPAIDTTTPKIAVKKNVFKKVLSYLRNDNLRESLFFSKMPLKIDPSFTKRFFTNYSLGADAQLRLYKNLFLNYDWQTNFGIGDVRITQTGFYFYYLFKVNKEHRPISISPIAGYNYIKLSNKGKSEKGVIDNLAVGTTISMELTHREEIFVTGLYNHSFNKNISFFPVQSANLSLSVGILLKL